MIARRSLRPLFVGAAGISLLLTMGAQPAFAADESPSQINVASEQTGGVDWQREDNVITILDTDGSGHAYVTVTGEAADGTRLVVAENTRAVIVLDEVNLNLGLSRLLGQYAALELSDGAVLDLQLAEGTVNTLIGARSNGTGGAGIYVPGGATLTIEGLGDGSGQLTAQGYVAVAGIGASRYNSSGTINIESGHVFVEGGDSAAGIGTHKGTQGPINISGGTVHAIGGRGSRGLWGGAGIGTGSGANGLTGAGVPGPINISGGQVFAEGRDGGAGIGAGHVSSGVKITITGGDVTAIGSGAGAGIGSSAMLGATAKSANLIVATGLDTAITATSGDNEGAQAIGLGDGDGSPVDTFVAVGGGLVVDGNTVAKNLTLRAKEGSSGAVYVEVPHAFTNVKDGRLRVANGLDPEVELALQTTLVYQPLKFTAKNFATFSPSYRVDELLENGAEILFEPVAMETDDTTVDEAATRAFLPETSNAMLAYLGVVMFIALGALLIGALVAHQRVKFARKMLAQVS